MRLSHFVAVLSSALASTAVASAPADTFHETLTLHPLPDGKLSVLFEFTTHFTLHKGEGRTPASHHSLTPPALLLPLERGNVSELTLSFTSGQWHQERHGESGPQQYEAAGAGGEVRGWLAGDDTDQAWLAVTQMLGGLFCSGAGAGHIGESARTFGALYPPARDGEDLTHYLVSSPHLHLCTENLTPFLSLLPSKGLSGISSLLAQPGIVLAWGFKTEGIDVVMPTVDQPGMWTGWWEGVVDLVPHRGGPRGFSISSLFQRPLPQPFARAASSRLRLVAPPEGLAALNVEVPPTREVREWRDGREREVAEWDLLDPKYTGADVKVAWQGEGDFVHPQHFTPPPITISRVAADKHASDATLVVEISNNADTDRRAVYSELWPWWVKGWLSEMTVGVKNENGTRDTLVSSIDYQQSVPPTPSMTTLHLHLTLPARSTLVLSIPFTKLTLKYTDHQPDAERGREIPASVLTLLDLEGEGEDSETAGGGDGDRPKYVIANHSCSGSAGIPLATDVRRSARTRVYGPKLLLDVPTPDFSMPYNVIIMTSTVMAVFFGSIQGRLIRRWGWVERENKEDKHGKAE